ncbi:MAG: nucleotide exchange factor GrpE [Paramuribaculum sp.]|nr:nucleotide exchange factor GrpE [Paramuribaculum sp.]
MSNKNKHQHNEKSQQLNDSPSEDMNAMDNVPDTDGENNSPEDIENSEMSELEAITNELNQTKEALEKEKREYLFLMAEFDNFRKRTIKEKSDIIRNAAESVLKGLLPIVDDFERGIAALENTNDADAAKEGMQLIYNKLMKYLEQNGVKPIESNGAEFNPDLHEAIAMVPTDNEEMKGKVIDTPTKGYTINDKVLRYAKVAVGQ